MRKADSPSFRVDHVLRIDTSPGNGRFTVLSNMIIGWRLDDRDLVDRTGKVRRVTVAIPPGSHVDRRVVHCADGQIVAGLTDALSRSGEPDLPVLIGVHSHDAVRAQEYLPSSDSLYLAHASLFVDRLRTWANAEYGINTDRERSAMFGVSNGGAFAIGVALQHPSRYSAAISFSPPKLTQHAVPDQGDGCPLIYVAVGDRGPEKQIRKHVLHLVRTLRRANIGGTLAERTGEGHTLDFWLSEFPIAYRWWCESVPLRGSPPL